MLRFPQVNLAVRNGVRDVASNVWSFLAAARSYFSAE
jgi:hypothetical protein